MTNNITITTDYGNQANLQALLSAALLREAPNAAQIVLSHAVTRGHFLEAAYFLDVVWKGLPDGTIHIVDVPSERNSMDVIAFAFHSQYFIMHDTGLMSLITRQEPVEVYKIRRIENKNLRWGMRNASLEMALAAGHLSRGGSLSEIGELFPLHNQSVWPIPTSNESSMRGVIMLIDSSGNCITNIHLEEFLLARDNRPYLLELRKIKIKRMYQNLFDNYEKISPGEEMLWVGENGYLTIGIKDGNLCQLHSLGINQSFTILFDPKA